mmetsp:Transcript_43942/g.126905  ORF Transcript_43942/g.126905 Transcript_43942/m.126905 type:complete len:141 (-) Transcript_43942:85-507(-)
MSAPALSALRRRAAAMAAAARYQEFAAAAGRRMLVGGPTVEHAAAWRGAAAEVGPAAAVARLSEDALCGNAEAAAQLAHFLRDTRSEVRASALDGLFCLSRFGPRDVARCAAESLKSSDAGLRWRSAEEGSATAALASAS